jgi:intracellular sulfur oxidation DsrE/DsrF family protein
MKYSGYLRVLFLCTFSLIFCTGLFAQANMTPAQQRAALMKKHESKMIYPFVRGSVMTGVLPVTDVTFPITAGKTYKLVFDFAYGNPEIYSQGLVNPGLEEICRILNLHSAAGISDKNMEVCIVFHGGGVWTFLHEDAYRERFGKDNPNINLINALQQKGVTLVVCGQSLQLRELDRTKLVPGVKVAFSARSTLSTLQQQGYVLFPVTTMD